MHAIGHRSCRSTRRSYNRIERTLQTREPPGEKKKTELYINISHIGSFRDYDLSKHEVFMNRNLCYINDIRIWNYCILIAASSAVHAGNDG